ncbi:MAG: hypothetical protein RSD08_03405 [Oscillospiraceae bacterium]
MKMYRTTTYRQMSSALYHFNTLRDKWSDKRCVLELTGPKGSRKTTFALDFFAEKRFFYFTFKGLGELMARRLLATRLSRQGYAPATQAWEDVFSSLDQMAARTKIIIFDDLDEIISDKAFAAALQAYIENPKRRRIFLVLIHADSVSLAPLVTLSHTIVLPYCSIAETKKSHPNRAGQEILQIYTLSGGIPEIINGFDENGSIEDNLRRMLGEKSPFLTFAEDVLERQFRCPESYAMILHALATGHTRVSEVGGFTGFAYNKCDKYIKALIAAGIVSAAKFELENGAEKTCYIIKNLYLHIWYEFVYPNRDLIAQGSFTGYFIEHALPIITKDYLAWEYIRACFRAAHGRWNHFLSFAIKSNVDYKPYTVLDKDFSYTFDCFVKDKNYAVFVKIFMNENHAIGRAELDELERAVALCHPYMDSYVYLFSKRRFSDYAVHQASLGTIKLFPVERLRF